MDCQQKEILFLSGVQKAGAQQRAVYQIKGRESVLLYPPRNLFLSLGGREHAKIHHRQGDRQRGMDNLRGLSIYHLKGSAKHLMLADDIVQTLCQGRPIQLPLELVNDRNIIERKLRLQLMEKP